MEKSTKYAWYALALLTMANISSFLDRQILSLLVKPIKRDLLLSDTQVSLLMGLSFALFYTLFGVFIGLGFGPTFVALLTDYVFKDESAIRYSMVTLFLVGGVLVTILSWLALKPYREAK